MSCKVSKEDSWMRNEVKAGTLRGKQKAEINIHLDGISFYVFESGGDR